MSGESADVLTELDALFRAGKNPSRMSCTLQIEVANPIGSGAPFPATAFPGTRSLDKTDPLR